MNRWVLLLDLPCYCPISQVQQCPKTAVFALKNEIIRKEKETVVGRLNILPEKRHHG